MLPEKIKILVIVGPTASGKSGLAVQLAKEFKGEIISVDSRQVYKGLDIATGKITEEEMEGIPHHLLSIADPKKQFSVAEFKALAEKEISNISSRKKLPIVVGGTGFYIQAVVDGITLPNVAPNKKLREELKNAPADLLFEKLKELDHRRAETIEKENPRRLIRAIEIAHAIVAVPEIKKEEKYETLQIGIEIEDDELRERIHHRTLLRFESGMIEEAGILHTKGLTLSRMRELGLEYKYLAEYIEGKINSEELREKIETADWQYSRRQLRWFKRDKRIQWFKKRDYNSIQFAVEKFLSKD